MTGEFWVGLVVNIIVVRTRGVVTPDAVHERHARIIQLAREAGVKNVLFDYLEAEAPPFEVTDAQTALNAQLKANGFRMAVLVPNSRLAFIARMAFGDVDHRIVYEDLAEATLWLSGREDATG